MNRKHLFDGIRQLAPRKILTNQMVPVIDQLADLMGYPREGEAGGLTPSQDAIDLMHEFEGCRLTAYPDPGSRDGKPWTIGWGSTGPEIVKGTVWTQKQADDRFAADLAKFSGKVRDLLGSSPTTQSQFDAMTSLAYNIGVGAFGGSTLLKKHKAGDFAGAQKAFGSWVYNDGKKMNGLIRRRAAEADLYGKG